MEWPQYVDSEFTVGIDATRRAITIENAYDTISIPLRLGPEIAQLIIEAWVELRKR